MKKRTKKDYTTEFRNRAVSMVLKSDKSIAQIARDLGVTGTTLYSWVNKNKTANTEEDGTTNEQLFGELKKLKRELAEVKEQRDILKKATAYFAKDAL